MSLEETVRQLQDQVDIQDLVFHYCRCADNLDGKAIASLFTEDGEADFTNGQLPVARGHEGLMRFFAAALADVASSSHHISNIELLFESRDTVIAQTYMYAWQRFNDHPERPDAHLWGRYELRLVRTPQGWRYSKLRLIFAGHSSAARIREHLGRPWPPSFG